MATDIRIEVTEAGKGCSIWLDGENIDHKVRGFTVAADVHHPSILVLEYVCAPGVVEGQATVIHKCPYGNKEESDGE